MANQIVCVLVDTYECEWAENICDHDFSVTYYDFLVKF